MAQPRWLRCLGCDGPRTVAPTKFQRLNGVLVVMPGAVWRLVCPRCDRG